MFIRCTQTRTTAAGATYFTHHLVRAERLGDKVRQRTLLKVGVAVAQPAAAFDVVRSLPHGHVAAVLGTLRKLRLERTLAAQHCAQRDRVLALIIARILNPQAKLATARGLAPDTASDSLAETLALGQCDEDDLYAAMDWLLERQDALSDVWPGITSTTGHWCSMI